MYLLRPDTPNFNLLEAFIESGSNSRPNTVNKDSLKKSRRELDTTPVPIQLDAIRQAGIIPTVLEVRELLFCRLYVPNNLAYRALET